MQNLKDVFKDFKDNLKDYYHAKENNVADKLETLENDLAFKIATFAEKLDVMFEMQKTSIKQFQIEEKEAFRQRCEDAKNLFKTAKDKSDEMKDQIYQEVLQKLQDIHDDIEKK